jgi:cytochrome b
MVRSEQVKVWDPVVRYFHWSLVVAFLIAYITEDDWLTIHSWAGYFIFALILVRIIWGFIGTKYARFSNFIYPLETIREFLKDTLKFKARRYLGHNPAGGAMVILLMACLLFTVSTGMLLLGADEGSGPFADWFTDSGDFWKDPLEGIHEFFANLTLLLVLIHIAGVILESILHGENLVSAMISGYKNNDIK